ncbi:MAG: NrsF family protein [Devosia sp.]|jgi:hypothetical protein
MTGEPISESSDISRLIGDLSADLTPVRRLAPPWLRAVYWLVAVLGLALVLIAIRIVFNWNGAAEVDPYVIPGALASGITAFLAAFAAFELSLPDRSSAWALLPLPAFAVWVAINGLGCVASLANPAVQSDVPQFFTCLAIIFALSIPLSAATIMMVRRARPLRPLPVAILGGLAASAAGATLLLLVHPHDSAVLDLCSHTLAVLVVVGINALIGGRLFVPANNFRRRA